VVSSHEEGRGREGRRLAYKENTTTARTDSPTDRARGGREEIHSQDQSLGCQT
jgi:hypothetical protein